jgi:hypothetical protein
MTMPGATNHRHIKVKAVRQLSGEEIAGNSVHIRGRRGVVNFEPGRAKTHGAALYCRQITRLGVGLPGVGLASVLTSSRVLPLLQNRPMAERRDEDPLQTNELVKLVNNGRTRRIPVSFVSLLSRARCAKA